MYDGAVATTLGPPTLAGWKDFNEYPGTATGKANVPAAKKQLKLCGKPHGFKATIVSTDEVNHPAETQFLQADLEKIGIHASIKLFDPATYYSLIVGDSAYIKAHHLGLAFAGWGPDWPAPYGFFGARSWPRATATTVLVRIRTSRRSSRRRCCTPRRRLSIATGDRSTSW